MHEFLFASVDSLMDLAWLLKTFGPLLVAVCFFIWRDARREDKLLTRVKELEDEQRNVVLPLVKDCAEVITRNTEVMEQNVKVMERLERIMG
jgi:hypothetical protein